jgi:hypothetical protein
MTTDGLDLLSETVQGGECRNDDDSSPSALHGGGDKVDDDLLRACASVRHGHVNDRAGRGV